MLGRIGSAAIYPMTATAILTLSFVAHADDGPSYDCNAASTADEVAICDDHLMLPWLDRQLAQAWMNALERVNTQGKERLRSAQRHWLAQRRNCSSDRDCLMASYVERLRELLPTNREFSKMTGHYIDDRLDQHQYGELLLVMSPDGKLSGTISSVSTPSFNLCEIRFDDAVLFDGQFLWTSSGQKADDTACKLSIRNLGRDDASISSQGCQSYCGLNGQFDGIYRKVTSR